MIPGVVLAAGKSVRMGRPKALLAASDDETFLTRIVRTFEAAGVPEIVVVLGHDAEAIAQSVTDRGLSPRFIVNREYERGQLSSLAAALEAIDRPGVTAMLMTLVDVPFVSAATVRAVVERYRETGAPVVRPVRGNRHGHPVIIDRRLFAGLRSADPALGAKPLVRANVSVEGDVVVEDEGAFEDVDTPEDYERLLSRSVERRR